MKGSLIKYMIILILTGFSGGVLAAPISTVYVTEKVPGAKCQCWYSEVAGDDGTKGQWMNGDNLACKDTPIHARKYRCEITGGFEGFKTILAGMIRYMVFISMLLGVLALTVLGILWATTGADSDKVKSVKGWFINIMVGLVILFCFRLILTFLAPWIYQ